MPSPTWLLSIILPVLVGLALMGIANLVVRNGAMHRHNVFFAALYFLSGINSLSQGLHVAADDWHAQATLFPPRLFWDLLGQFCSFGMMPLLLLFVASFPRPVWWMTKSARLGTTLAFVPSAMMAVILVMAMTGQVAAQAYYAGASAFNLVFFGVTVLAILLLLRTRMRSPDAIERTQATYVLLGFLPGFVTGWAVTLLQIAQENGSIDGAMAQTLIDGILAFVSPLLELVACSLVAFAILKYNILGIDPKFRLGVKSVVAGLMFITLFLVTQFIENVVLQGKVFAFAGQYGSFILSGSVGLVLFKPIEKASDRVSNRLLPGSAAVGATEKAGAPVEVVAAATLHAEQIYHAQATYVLRDAHVSDRELAFLANLRTQLGLTEEQARRIEETVERILKVDAPQTGHSAAPTASSAAIPPIAEPAAPAQASPAGTDGVGPPPGTT